MSANKIIRQFFKAHPEFNNFERNLVHSLPSYNIKLNPKRQEEATLILENLSIYPNSFVQQVLFAYYEGASISQIARQMGVTKKQASRRIFGFKQSVVNFIKNGFKIPLEGKRVYEKRVVTHKGKKAQLYKINYSSNLLWVSADGTVLPEDVQDFLENGLTEEKYDFQT